MNKNLGPSEPRDELADVSVIICAYTAERWSLLEEAIASVLTQTLTPRELILCIDHNPELFERCLETYQSMETSVPIHVVENRYGGRLGSARTTALEIAKGKLVAFLDDDAAADSDWLEQLLQPLEDLTVAAVGGAPVPRYGKPRPAWFPFEYDWVFGCRYLGLPTETAPVHHLIGAAMAARTSDLLAFGGFHSDNHDDMDMCHRLLEASPTSRILYVPSATVSHFVPANRLTWHYFWRRCFFVNHGKVGAFRTMGTARNLEAERTFLKRVFVSGLKREITAFGHGDRAGAQRAFSLCAGLILAGSGYAAGSIEWIVRERFTPSR